MVNYVLQDLFYKYRSNQYNCRYIVSESNLIDLPIEDIESTILSKLGAEIGIGLVNGPNRPYDLLIDIDPQTFCRRYMMTTFCFSRQEVIDLIQDAYNNGRQDSIENSLTFSRNPI